MRTDPTTTLNECERLTAARRVVRKVADLPIAEHRELDDEARVIVSPPIGVLRQAHQIAASDPYV